ncbi:amidohydrolase family protein [Flavobacterium sp. CSZ]|uniref:amidohydrolase family protein n=1 Tax=Flavobacterium sp. CSZ TaxID=2783791 RepID=UPI001889EA7B|nr:amidohydrolase family protein [Flavobacterium sp. CSZ]MBF4487783.1 amidohydrolase family protein [Flavobacterium sp. CSZ]
MTIDSHQHFWIYEAEKHAWIDDDMKVIRKNFLPEDLKLVYQTNHIDGCVAIQADQTLAETDFLLDLAQKNDFIKGVVGWVDLRAPNIDTVLNHYSKFIKLKGFRHVLQDEDDHNFMLRPDFLNGIATLEKYSFTYDILIFPHQLGAALELVRRFPNQKFVIDHGGKPYIKEAFYDGWAALIKEISKCPNVYCKLSGMTTEADYNNWTAEQIEPYMQLILDAFGASKILFGSDWPVCLVAGNYTKTKQLVTNFISKLSSEEQTAIMGGNTIKFYDL